MRFGRTVTRTTQLVVSVLLLGIALAPAAAGAATDAPSLRLFAAQSHVIVERPHHQPFQVDPGIFVTAVGGAFHLELHRAALGDPISLEQVWTDDTSTHTRALPTSALQGWSGLKDFFNITVHDATGKVVHRETRSFCPNAYSPQRIKPNGVSAPTFPAYCGIAFDPFLQGNLWGIDHGWAVNPLSSGQVFFGPGPIFGDGIRLRLPDGTYQVRMAVAGRYIGLFGMDPARSAATIRLTVKKGSLRCPPLCPGDLTGPPHGGELPPIPDVRTSSPPDPQYLPDLEALPAFDIYPYHRFGQDYLSFASTEWVGGGSNLDVQGFRRHNANTMDAYQYFFKDGEVVGKAKVGTLEFDTRPGHQHWHFEQFAQYQLLDSDKSLVVRSHKQSFCIAPTDAIDLTLPGAVPRPDFLGFLGNCGTPTSVWVHEQMALGWGDTYLQNVAGQAFNITDLPNGTYFVSIQVNPLGLLYEQSTSNDTTLRRVVIMGTPGHRTVCVPPIRGVDQEGTCKA
jgi:Lysyl oxidase